MRQCQAERGCHAHALHDAQRGEHGEVRRVCKKRGGHGEESRLTIMPVRRSMWRLNRATAKPAAAMPKVQALTARPMADGDTPAVHQLRQQGLRGEQIDHCEKGHGRNHNETDRPIHHGVVLVYARIGGRNGSLCHGTLSPSKRSDQREAVPNRGGTGQGSDVSLPVAAGLHAVLRGLAGDVGRDQHDRSRRLCSSTSATGRPSQPQPPVLCSIGTWQWLEYSVIEPDTT